MVDRRVERFIADGGRLDRRLRAQGFAVPGFFAAIGPLAEWRRGETASIGDDDALQCLSWF